MDKALSLANELEGTLRNYLDCHYTEFGVKANDNLLTGDWKSPINLALGHKYGKSNNSLELKGKIDYFVGNTLQGKNIQDVIQNYDYYNFDTQDDAYKYIKDTISELNNILQS